MEIQWIILIILVVVVLGGAAALVYVGIRNPGKEIGRAHV